MKNYDPKNIFITLAGLPLGGWADGVFAATETEANLFKKSVGAVGNVTRTRMHNKSGQLTLTIVSTSQANDFLNDLFQLDMDTGLGYGALLIKDLNGTTKLAAPNAWIVRRPEFEAGSDASNREWIIEYDKMDGVIGGATI